MDRIARKHRILNYKSEEPKDLIIQKLIKKEIENKDGSVTIKYNYETENITKKINEESNTIKIETVEEMMKKLEKENK